MSASYAAGEPAWPACRSPRSSSPPCARDETVPAVAHASAKWHAISGSRGATLGSAGAAAAAAPWPARPPPRGAPPRLTLLVWRRRHNSSVPAAVRLRTCGSARGRRGEDREGLIVAPPLQAAPDQLLQRLQLRLGADRRQDAPHTPSRLEHGGVAARGVEQRVQVEPGRHQRAAPVVAWRDRQATLKRREGGRVVPVERHQVARRAEQLKVHGLGRVERGVRRDRAVGVLRLHGFAQFVGHLPSVAGLVVGSPARCAGRGGHCQFVHGAPLLCRCVAHSQKRENNYRHCSHYNKDKEEIKQLQTLLTLQQATRTAEDTP
eukprot:scaffold3539_cov112-Isochrysis_galbana.AAC.2